MSDGPLSGARGAGLVATAAIAEVATQVATGHVALAVGAFALVLGLGIAPWFKARAAQAAANTASSNVPMPASSTPRPPYRGLLRAGADATPERALADLERAMTQLRQNVAFAIDDLGKAAERDGVAIADVAARLAADIREIHEGMAEVVARVDETDARERVQALEIQFAALAQEFGGFIQATAEAAERDEAIVDRLDHAARATDRFESRLDEAREGYARALVLLGDRLDATLAALSDEAQREARRAEARERDVAEGFERVEATSKRIEREVGDAGHRVEAAVEATARRLESTSRAASDESRRFFESSAARLAEDLLAVRATLRGVETRLAEAGPAAEARDAASAAKLARLEESSSDLGRRLDDLAKTLSAEFSEGAKVASETLSAAERHIDASELRVRDELTAARRAIEALEREATETEALLVEKLGDARAEARAAREAALAASTTAREAGDRVAAFEARFAGRLEATLQAIDGATIDARAAATQTLGRIEASDRATSAALADVERALSGITLDLSRVSTASEESIEAMSKDLAARLESGRLALTDLGARLDEQGRRAQTHAERLEEKLASGTLLTREVVEDALAASRATHDGDRRDLVEALDALAGRIGAEAEAARANLVQAEGRLDSTVKATLADAQRATASLAGDVAALARRLDESAARGSSRLAVLEESIASRLAATEARMVEDAKTLETRIATRLAENSARLEDNVRSRSAEFEGSVATLARDAREDTTRLAASLERLEQSVSDFGRTATSRQSSIEETLDEVARGFDRALSDLSRDASKDQERLHAALAAVSSSLTSLRAEVGNVEDGLGAHRAAASELETRVLDAIRGLGQALATREDQRSASLSGALRDVALAQSRLAEDVAKHLAAASGRAEGDASRHEVLYQASNALAQDLEALRGIVVAATRTGEAGSARIEAAVAEKSRILQASVREAQSAVESTHQGLALRLEGLEDAASSLHARLDAVERAVGEEADLLAGVAREEGSTVGAAIEDAREALTRETMALKETLERSIADLTARVDPRGAIDAASERLTASDQSLHESTRTELGHRLTALGEGLARAEAATARVADAIVERDAADAATLSALAARFAARTEALEAAFSDTRGAILAASAATGADAIDLKTRFSRVEGRLDAIVEANRSLETTVAPLLAATHRVEEGVETGLARLGARLDAHAAAEREREEAARASFATAVADANEHVATGLNQRLGELEDRLAADLGQVAAAALESTRRLGAIEQRLDAGPSPETIAASVQPLVRAGDLVSKDLAYLAASDDRIADRIETLAKGAAERGDALLQRLAALEERFVQVNGVSDHLEGLESQAQSMRSELSGEMRAMRDDFVRATTAAAERERDALEGLAETATAIELRFDAFRRDADRRDALVESRLKDATDAARSTAERLTANEAVTAARLADHAQTLTRAVESGNHVTRAAVEAAQANVLEEIHERLGTLETDVLSSLDGVHERTVRDLSLGTDRVAADLVALQSKVDGAVRSAAERIDSRFETLEPRLATHDAHVRGLAEAIREGFGEATARTDRLNTDLEAILARVTALDARAERDAESVRLREAREGAERGALSERLTRDLDALGNRLEDAAYETRHALLDRLAAGEASDENLALDIRALAGQLEGMEAVLSRSIESKDAEVTKRLDRFEEFARRLETKVTDAEAALARRLDDVTRTLERLTSETTATAETTRSRVVGEVEAINRELRSLEARVADRGAPVMRAPSAPVESRVADLGARVERALGRLEGLSTRPAEPPQTTSDALASRLAALETQRATLESALKQPALPRARPPAKLSPPTRMPPPRPGLAPGARPPSKPEANAVQALGASFATEVAELRRYFQGLDAALSEAASDVGDERADGESAKLLAHVNELRADFEILDRRLAAMGDGVAKALGRLDQGGPGQA